MQDRDEEMNDEYARLQEQIMNQEVPTQGNQEQQTHYTYYIWTKAEEQLLMDQIVVHGLNWKKIQEQFFKRLTPSQIKNKYYSLKRRSLIQEDYQDMVSQIEDPQPPSITRLRSQSMHENNVSSMVQTLLELIQQTDKK
ncbi:Myb-like_DNA-binding domain-containing protein [Hexamita inflata]|uniref:Myb-like DNA-binding domain-containing protein n=1 Tax=Hexamita inflata TaxID=28002 RepID=A0AA86P4Q9_9EUKA|nr:Myb-like DNA-binding domain-containing protein [Hexamita inflata]CAI9961978.1 Myb-like DNA-binding domain-containing protein [Hexamita inflata]